MDTVWQTITSEFFLGIIIGAFLTAVGAYMSFHLQTRRMRQIMRRFCYDAVTNISEHIQNMDAHRDRARQIHHDFISLLEAEIGVVMRNKEHIVQIDNENIRRRLRDFFNYVAINLVLIKDSLNRFYEAQRLSQSDSDEKTQALAATEAARLLAEAHRACDKLVGLLGEAKELKATLR